MKTVLSGDITIFDPTEEVASWVEDNLTLTNPVYSNLIKRGQQDTIARRHVQQHIKCFQRRNGALIVPFGCLRAIWPMLKDCEWSKDFAPNAPTRFGTMPCAVNLYDYQKKAVEALIEAKGGILKSGCGSGKTYIGIEVLRRLGLRFLWLCGKSDLLNQTMKNIKSLYPEADVGTITEGEVNMGSDGTISTVQTMVNVDYRLYENEFNVVVVDECHTVTNNPTTRQMYAKVLGRCKARYKYGLSATPKRQDGLTKLIYANIGVSKTGAFRPTYQIKDSETQSLQAEYVRLDMPTKRSFSYLTEDGSIDHPKLMAYLADNTERNNAIVAKIKEYVEKENRKVAVLTQRVDHSELLAGMLRCKGVKAESVTGKTKKKDRNEALENPDSWDVIVSTTQLFKEGLDIKALDTVFVALPFKDENAIQQSEGRAERPLEGKNDPLFVFVCDPEIEFSVQSEKRMRRILTRKRK